MTEKEQAAFEEFLKINRPFSPDKIVDATIYIWVKIAWEYVSKLKEVNDD